VSIRAITGELYRLMKQVEELERQLAAAPPDAADSERLREQIRTARAERDRLKGMLAGAKA